MTELFNIGLETDLSEFDTTATDGGDLAQSGAAALAGTAGGMSCLIDDTNQIYGEKTFSSVTRFRCRFYIDINSLTMADGDVFNIAKEISSSKIALRLKYTTASGYQINIQCDLDSGTDVTGDYDISDAEHYIEFDWAAASSPGANDGFLSLYLDGSLQETLSSLDNDTVTIDRMAFGAFGVDSGTSGTLYLDEMVANDDGSEIGASGLSQDAAGTITPAGALARKVFKALAGALTPAGSLATGFKSFVALVGALTPAGTLATQFGRVIAGAITPAGSLVGKALKALAGALAPAGSLAGKALKPLAGALAPAGSLAGKALKPLAGALAPAGSLATSYLQALLNAQKTLGGIPSLTLTVGSESLGAFILAYHYEQQSEERGYLAVWLDNRADQFDDLATDYPTLTRGAAVTLSRAVTGTVEGVQALPRCWVESLEYTEDGALLLTCIDWWGRLEGWRYAADTQFTAQTHSAIATSILGQVGLTLDSGSFGFSTDFKVSKYLDGDEALQDLMGECHEKLYAGLAGEILWKQLDPAEAAGYTYDFAAGTSDHPLIDGKILETTARYNKVTVLGGPDLQYTGSATDATEVTLTGQTRLLTVENGTLTSNVQCTEQAESLLRQEQSQAEAAILIARPHFTLNLYDVVTVTTAPAWGGPAITGRVIEIVEDYDIRRDREELVWEQEITLGGVFGLGLDAGDDYGSRRSRRRRERQRRRQQRRQRRRRRRSRTQSRTSPSAAQITSSPGVAGSVPLGAIIMWSGASIPSGWALCNGSNGTPDLRDRFIVGSGSTYSIDDTGGAATADLEHRHGPGSLATESKAHVHTKGTLLTDSDSHTHGSSTLATDSDIHSHNAGTLAADSDSHSHNAGTLAADGAPDSTQGIESLGTVDLTVALDDHGHTVSGATANDAHTHTVSGASATDSHSHSVDSGLTDSDAHSHGMTGSTASTSHMHDVTAGLAAAAGSTTEDIRPPYYALAFIMRIV